MIRSVPSSVGRSRIPAFFVEERAAHPSAGARDVEVGAANMWETALPSPPNKVRAQSCGLPTAQTASPRRSPSVDIVAGSGGRPLPP